MEILQRRAVDNVERIDDVAERLGHLAAFGVAYEGVAEDFREGDLPCELDPEHDHARNPEEENIPASLEDGHWVELLHVGGLVGPAEGREGPEAGGEPCVEDIGVLLKSEILARVELVGFLLGLLFGSARYPLLTIGILWWWWWWWC